MASVVLPAEAILFDLDGVLADSGRSIERAWRSWAVSVGVPWTRVYPAIPGRIAGDTIRTAVPSYVSEEWVLEAALVVNREQITDGDDTCVFPGMSEFFSSVPSDRVAVVTSAPRELAVARLTRRGLGVPAVLVTAEDVQHGKPDPEGWLRALAALHAEAESCVAIEDAPVGVASACAAHMRVIAVSTTHTSDVLRRATAIVEDGRQLACRCPSLDMVEVLVGSRSSEASYSRWGVGEEGATSNRALVVNSMAFTRL